MLKLRMCANLNRKIIHNQCEYNNDNFMYKIGLANWKIRPWILAKKRRLTMKNIFFTTSCASKKRNNYWTTYGISDSTKLLLLTLLLTTHCLAQQISSTERWEHHKWQNIDTSKTRIIVCLTSSTPFSETIFGLSWYISNIHWKYDILRGNKENVNYER